jgi:hypothetical protein
MGKNLGKIETGEITMNTTMKASGEADPSVIRKPGQRLEEIALALVLIMTGALWLAPKVIFPEGTWLAGVGLILLGLNAARGIRGLKTSGFGIIAGLVAFAAGVGRIIGRDLPIVPALLVVLGVALIIKAATAPGKTEDVPGAF